MILKRTETQINDVLSKCEEYEHAGTNPWPGETYSAGVKNAILWITGQYDDNPMAE